MNDLQSAVILLSRQNLRPSLSDEWVRSLKKAVEFVKSNNYKLLSSVGTPNWEITTACTSRNDISLSLFVPVLQHQDKIELSKQIKAEFALGASHKLIWLQSHAFDKLTQDDFLKRDESIVNAADIIIPVSVNPDGNMSKLIQKAKNAGKSIVSDFQVKYQKSSHKLSYAIDQSQLSNDIKQFNSDYIFHWTRATNGPWPGEQRIEYYRDILSSDSYPRDAFETLKRIVKSKLICGSSKNMPGNTKTVSFSGLKPVDTIKLMCWRARFRQMSFEPFGIGIEKETALQIGIEPVKYYDPGNKEIPNDTQPWLTQSLGRITDWRNEKEFRHRGDLDLSSIPKDKMIVVTYKKNEALEIEKKSKIKTIQFCD